MKYELVVDSTGRIVLPETVRQQLHLTSGTILEMEVQPKAIVLHPRAHCAALVAVNGWLVHEGNPEGDLPSTVDDARLRRDHDLGQDSP